MNQSEKGKLTMRAALATAYGGPEVLEIGEVVMPEPKPGEVRIRVITAAVNTGDWRLRSGKVPFGFGLMVRLLFGMRRLRQPILGWEAAGVVDALGADVQGLAVGQEVVAWPAAPKGCHAEYFCLKAENVIAKPAALNWEEAGSMCFGGITALTFLRWGGLVAGRRVLIIGASGAVGSAGVQIAKAHGLAVTAVTSKANAEMMLKLGADSHVDYETTPLDRLTGPYDMILDCQGTVSWPTARRLLTPKGVLLAVVGDIGTMLRALLLKGRSQSIRFGDATGARKDMVELAALAEAGRYRPLIDSSYALEDVRKAHVRVDGGHKRGSVVLRIGAEPSR